jgi:hypothetical protein
MASAVPNTIGPVPVLVLRFMRFVRFCAFYLLWPSGVVVDYYFCAYSLRKKEALRRVNEDSYFCR